MQHDKRPFLVGITGNIGSGKSTFCQILMNHGLNVYFADTIANQRLEDPNVVISLLQHFGEAILSNDPQCGLIDRKKLAEIVFSDYTYLDFLNSVLHPLVLMDLQEIVENCAEELICIEIPLLFEADLSACFDYLVLVTASEPLRMARLKSRGESETRIKQRIHAQWDDSHKKDKVDFIVENNDSTEHLEQLATQLIEAISKAPLGSVRPFYPGQ